MNKIEATVTAIENVDNLHIVTFQVANQQLKMMSLDLDKHIKRGRDVILSFKANSVAIAKEFTGSLSYSNQLPVTIKSIESGRLLASLTLTFASFTFESIITADALKRLDLHEGEHVTALIKSNDISILEILS